MQPLFKSSAGKGVVIVFTSWKAWSIVPGHIAGAHKRTAMARVARWGGPLQVFLED